MIDRPLSRVIRGGTWVVRWLTGVIERDTRWRHRRRCARDIAAIDKALASGERVVVYADGRRVTYKSVDELKAVVRDMRENTIEAIEAIEPTDALEAVDAALASGELVVVNLDDIEASPSNPLAKTTLTDGSPITDDHREIQPGGMQKGYVVLSKAEREKGYVRPLRAAYVHDACGAVTTMSVPLAETIARDPKFYDATFCTNCRTHFPLAEFKWCGTDERVGS